MRDALVSSSDGEFKTCPSVGVIHIIVGENQSSDLVHLKQSSGWITVRDLISDGRVGSCRIVEDVSIAKTMSHNKTSKKIFFKKHVSQ